jgi:hypothetical protein
MNPISHRSLLRPALFGLFLILLLGAGCQRVAPVRTLPSWVRGVYIPVVKNDTVEPGIEDVVTRQIQEAFLTDGRVDVVPKDRADLVLKVELINWRAETVRTRGDYIGRTSDVTVTVGIKLYDPFDLDKPMADLGHFVISTAFNIDTRSNRYEPEPDRKERLLASVAQQVLAHVMSGFPAQAAGAATGVNVQQFRTPETIQMQEPLKSRPEQDAPAQGLQ